MSKKFFVLALLSVFVFGAGFVGTDVANAQVATFPAGCTSALGYSITTGLPCNGTATATIGFLPGCTTALGFSTVNGVACSGGPFAISYLAGCTSIYGYSIISGAACNGTSVAVVDPNLVPPPVFPGLPVTGAGGDALRNIVLLMTSGLVAAFGVQRFVRRTADSF